MLYNLLTGKRVKQPFNHISWVHKAMKYENFELNQCLFGEHLLASNKSKPVSIVESEKTAIIASMFYPDELWLASGQLNGLNVNKCKVLAERKVKLFPDLSQYKRGQQTTFQKWSDKSKELSCITDIQVSDFLENIATDEMRKSGCDIADYLVTLNYADFAKVDNEAF